MHSTPAPPTLVLFSIYVCMYTHTYYTYQTNDSLSLRVLGYQKLGGTSAPWPGYMAKRASVFQEPSLGIVELGAQSAMLYHYQPMTMMGIKVRSLAEHVSERRCRI